MLMAPRTRGKKLRSFLLLVLLFVFNLALLNKLNYKASQILKRVESVNTRLGIHEDVENAGQWSEVSDMLHALHDLFVIDPNQLMRSLSHHEQEQLHSRFDFPRHISQCSACLTLGVFANQLDNILYKLKHHGRNVTELSRITCLHPVKQSTTLCHIFYQQGELRLHLVVFHHIDNYLWIGDIPTSNQTKLSDFVLHYGHYQEIYDLFTVQPLNFYPDDIFHFLSQITTSRYLHCPMSRRKWLKNHNVSVSLETFKKYQESIDATKSLMRTLRMQFWMVCGTLLGWHRQCHITPYTTDTDFATWSRYLIPGQGPSTEELKALAPAHHLKLLYRFGEPLHSLEYSFSTRTSAKVDMFVIYPNGTHHLLPFHLPPSYAYSIYPNYKLCSAALLGYKLLLPCTPEEVVLTEYGSDWMEPLKSWNYASSPHNIGPLMPYPQSWGDQMHKFQ